MDNKDQRVVPLDHSTDKSTKILALDGKYYEY
jgi:hypothetical protein